MIYLLVIILLILATIYIYIKNFTQNASAFNKFLISLSIVLFTFGVILFPEESFKSAYDGLDIWFNVVCPSLLPFFIGSKLLINLGIVSFIGALLEPIMRPLFNVPGCGSFPFVMSITSGYPVGAKIVGELYRGKQCTKAEAQRLMAFCSTSGPLFMIGAVSIGMLNLKIGGTIIATSHYLGALTLGLIFRFYKYKDRTSINLGSQNIKNAINKLIESFKCEKRTLGSLLSEAIKDSINTLLLVGGFIVLFSVIIRLMTLSGIIDALSLVAYNMLKPLGMDRELFKPVASGIFEITIGSKLVASSQAAAAQKITAISSIIAWSGFSIHAQVAGMISNTDLKMGVYMLSKAIHGILSLIYAYLIIAFMDARGMLQSLQVFSPETPGASYNPAWVSRFTFSSETFICTIAVLLCLAVAHILFYKLITLFNH